MWIISAAIFHQWMERCAFETKDKILIKATTVISFSLTYFVNPSTPNSKPVSTSFTGRCFNAYCTTASFSSTYSNKLKFL